jgi:phage terminase large subunit
MPRKADDSAPTWLEVPSAAEVLGKVSGQPHAVARCRWCGGPFGRAYGASVDTQQHRWVCLNLPCAERQLRYAMPKQKQFFTPDGTPILYMPLPLQVDLRESPYKRTLLAGAAGSCKSFGARWDAYAACRATPGFQVLLLRATLKQLEKNHLKFMAYEALQLGDAKYSGGNVMTMTFTNESQMSMGYCENKGDIANHLGPEWDKIIIEEANNIIEDALAEIPARDRGSPYAKRPAGVEKDGTSLLLANPGGVGSMALVDHYIEKKPDLEKYPEYNPSMHGHIQGTLDDNPYLAEDYARTTLSGLNAARYRQMRHGDWNAVAGQFFGQFTSETHVRSMEAS